MKCPYCNSEDSKVVDSRDVNDGVRRRRQCLNCNSRFTTYERIQSSSLFVIKKDQRREEFNKEKLLSGIQKACGKRPLPIGAVEKLADDIEAEIYHMGKSEIASYKIGDMVMEGLRGLDYIAYIRFASVYREFSDITDLKQEVDTLVSAGIIKKSEASGQLTLLPDESENSTIRQDGNKNG
ncbi:MAG: transcriptional regulator NrdR [Dehalococcoidales bacterium]|nr:transcriptional regulator NrdR [Dehalococcoidales bacterium]